VSANDIFCKALVTDLDRILSGLVDVVVYQQQGHAALETNMHAHYNQRSTNRGWGCQKMAYQNDDRDDMEAKLTTTNEEDEDENV